jgi:hypothetical protein
MTMTPWIDAPRRATLYKSLTAALMLAAVSILLVWSWNALAADLFGAPRFQFRHAVAVLVLGLLAAWALRFAGPRRRGASSAER